MIAKDEAAQPREGTDPTFLALPSRTQATLASVSAAVKDVIPSEVRSWRVNSSTLPGKSADCDLITEVAE